MKDFESNNFNYEKINLKYNKHIIHAYCNENERNMATMLIETTNLRRKQCFFNQIL